jgi:hypothetical protein
MWFAKRNHFIPKNVVLGCGAGREKKKRKPPAPISPTVTTDSAFELLQVLMICGDLRIITTHIYNSSLTLYIFILSDLNPTFRIIYVFFDTYCILLFVLIFKYFKSIILYYISIYY